MSSWGRLSAEPHEVVALSQRRSAAAAVARSAPPGIAYGNGRSYGDACLNAGGVLWATRGLDRFIAWNPADGELECEAGVTLDEVIELTLPQGWFLPVTPGTRYVTVGGAIANDVHGKNHHAAGCFGEHVEQLTLLRTDGTEIVCGPGREPDWFAATVGGLGLTGLIVSARLRLRRVPGPWIDVESTPFDSLDDFFALSEQASSQREYTVSWVDCGAMRDGRTRGIFFAGDHAPSSRTAPRRRARRMPVTPPWSLVNRATLPALNSLSFHGQRLRRGAQVQHSDSFVYPLDGMLEWNRLYGPRGFYQYQCVVPEAAQRAAIAEVLSLIARSGAGSFLAVLKTFGPRPATGLLSFPLPGTTLAIDFANGGAATLELFDRLDAVVAGAGGRLYPAKDARMPMTLFKSGFPRWSEFEAFRDPGISSQMSRRIAGH